MPVVRVIPLTAAAAALPCSQVVVCKFKLPAKVTSVAMSPVATSHCLVAAALQEPNVKLCDPTSGATTHTLAGHK